MAESKKELKSLLMRVKEESEKPGLKLNVKKNEGPITAWQIEGENGSSDTCYFLGLQSQRTVAADMKLKDAYSLEEKL